MFEIQGPLLDPMASVPPMDPLQMHQDTGSPCAPHSSLALDEGGDMGAYGQIMGHQDQSHALQQHEEHMQEGPYSHHGHLSGSAEGMQGHPQGGGMTSLSQLKEAHAHHQIAHGETGGGREEGEDNTDIADHVLENFEMSLTDPWMISAAARVEFLIRALHTNTPGLRQRGDVAAAIWLSVCMFMLHKCCQTEHLCSILKDCRSWHISGAIAYSVAHIINSVHCNLVGRTDCEAILLAITVSAPGEVGETDLAQISRLQGVILQNTDVQSLTGEIAAGMVDHYCTLLYHHVNQHCMAMSEDQFGLWKRSVLRYCIQGYKSRLCLFAEAHVLVLASIALASIEHGISLSALCDPMNPDLKWYHTLNMSLNVDPSAAVPSPVPQHVTDEDINIAVQLLVRYCADQTNKQQRVRELSTTEPHSRDAPEEPSGKRRREEIEVYQGQGQPQGQGMSSLGHPQNIQQPLHPEQAALCLPEHMPTPPQPFDEPLSGHLELANEPATPQIPQGSVGLQEEGQAGQLALEGDPAAVSNDQRVEAKPESAPEPQLQEIESNGVVPGGSDPNQLEITPAAAEAPLPSQSPMVSGEPQRSPVHQAPQEAPTPQNMEPQERADAATPVLPPSRSTVDIVFIPGQPLGISILGSEVICVEAKGQGEERAVKLGWRLKGLNGGEFKTEVLKELLSKSGQPFTITFEKAEQSEAGRKASEQAAKNVEAALSHAQSLSQGLSTAQSSGRTSVSQPNTPLRAPLPHPSAGMTGSVGMSPLPGWGGMQGYPYGAPPGMNPHMLSAMQMGQMGGGYYPGWNPFAPGMPGRQYPVGAMGMIPGMGPMGYPMPAGVPFQGMQAGGGAQHHQQHHVAEFIRQGGNAPQGQHSGGAAQPQPQSQGPVPSQGNDGGQGGNV